MSPRISAVAAPALVWIALASTTAVAAPEPAFDSLDTPEGAIPIDPPGNPPASEDAPPDPQALGDKIMFINFDGGEMNGCGNNDPAQNCSTIWGGTVNPYTGDAAKRATVIQIVRQRTEDFGITVTDTRPAAGDYDMEMVGDWAGVDDPGFAGVAPSIDCFDQRGGETSFTLEAAGTSDGMAEIILQEIAHTWGLEHVDNPADLLYPTTQGQNKAFRDECLKIVANTDLDPSGGQCNSMHTQFCNSGWQNSYQELLELFGPAVADTEAPIVEILAPTEGEEIDGGNVTMVLRLADNLQPVIINATIHIDGTGLDTPVEEDGAYAGPAELEFPINNLPDGEYTISIDAEDEYDNPASDQVSFTVVGNPSQAGEEGGSGGAETSADDGAAEGSGGESGGGEAGGSGEGGSGDDDDDDDDDDASAGVAEENDASDEACACSQRREGPLGMGLLVVFAMGLRRRRAAA